MAADIISCIARMSTALILPIYDALVRVFHKKILHIPALTWYQYQEMI